MANKFTEQELLSLVKGITIPKNETAVKALALKILDTEDYTNGNKYLNNRYSPIRIDSEYFNVSLTLNVTPVQAKKIAELVKDDYKKHKISHAVDALILAGFTEKEATAMIEAQEKKKKGK
jgi:hypothetical protein